MSEAMARPPFDPDRHQAALMRRLGRHTERMAQLDAEFTALIAEAKEAGVPIEHIAREAGVAVKTIYNRLGRLP